MASALAPRYRELGTRAFTRALADNDENIGRFLAARLPLPSLLDLGCDDGSRTMRYAQAAQASDVYGVEVVESRAALARERGIDVVSTDLGGRLPYADNAFAAVVSNQVIEHLFDTDRLLAEAFRVLRPGGVIVTSTENLASWHNVASLVLGWQPFSLTNVSTQGPIGNPFGLAVGGETSPLVPGEISWQHRRVFASRGLLELHRAHGFIDLSLAGAGYYPLPSRMGRVNPGHAAFITVSGQRP
jgi:SAM-dependent methyltransferase